MRSKLRWWPPVLAAGFLILGLSTRFWAADGAAPADQKDLDKKIRAMAKIAINKGADLHNIYRDSAGCYRFYQGSLTTLRGLLDHHPDLQKTIDTALADAEKSASMAQRGLVLNGALRKVWDKLNPNPKAGTDGAKVTDKPATDKPATDGKPKDKPARDAKPKDKKPADKVIPKDLLKDVKPADKPAPDKPRVEKVPFDKPAKDK